MFDIYINYLDYLLVDVEVADSNIDVDNTSFGTKFDLNW